MALQVVNNAQLMCSFGASPACLAVLPANRVKCGEQPSANIIDYAPMMNIAAFGVCMSPSNPQVAAATAAAMGVLTPQPCIPATMSPWSPGVPKVQIAQFPALDDASTCACMWGGVISVAMAGQTTTDLP